MFVICIFKLNLDNKFIDYDDRAVLLLVDEEKCYLISDLGSG